MSQFVSIGHSISVAAIRDYLFAKRIDKGDSLVLNPADYDHIGEEMKNSDEPIDIPVNVLGVLLLKDTTGDVPAGKVQIVKNETL
ncbi:hypothetical protein FMM05_12085 [Flavobacterium zepuense]|uniref:Uncharacterized protein n=1 Tax=Flavobacterium zepuense TaxID=2593302 RepID=A0A552V089_9FLAO|nr:hypothetical protein [Flavobacterium zepuense]TRW23893.1 hypothetical protein FMM05_12085 [Flavobacterium zepuense]